MTGITSGVGLISGLPTAQLIDSLIAAQSRPKDLLTKQLTDLQTQRSSLLELNARLVALKGTAGRLELPSFFNQFAAASSDDSVLTATAGDNALPGVFDLVVKSLVTSHQMISGGFPDAGTTPVGIGELTIEIGQGSLNRPTALGDLNGGAGVRRGTFEITDRAGHTAQLDLSAAVNVTDVLDLINTASEIDVRARVEGNHLVVEDLSGGSGTLNVVDLNGGAAALDLGIRQSASAATLTGSDVFRLADSTSLALLNDGNGVRRGLGDDFAITNANGERFTVRLDGALNDATRLEVLNNGNGVRLGVIRLSNRAGATGTVDLTAAQTVGDVRAAIEAAVDETGASLQVTASALGIGGVGSLSLTDGSDPPERPADVSEEDLPLPKFSVENVSGFAANDLGIATSTTDGSIVGSGIHRVTSIGDVLRAINFADGNNGTVTASLTGNGMRLVDNTGSPVSTPLVVEALDDGRGGVSRAAADLGIEGALSLDYQSRDLLAGLNTVLLHTLNGGTGYEMGTVSFQARDGSAPVTVDFNGAQTVQDIITLINTNVPGVEASLNAVGHGIAVTDSTGQALNDLTITDVSGTLAADLGLAGSHANSSAQGSNLQLQYLNERSPLDDLNGGRGVREGSLQFTNTKGDVFAVELDSGQQTLGDVIAAINQVAETFGVRAGINATGDGIAITDTNGGDKALAVADVGGGSAAEDLRIAGKANEGETVIDGTFEITVRVDADDTLEDVAAKLHDASPDLNAAVLNDGASSAPYRLSVTSGVTGKRGELVFDAGTTGLNMSTLVAAQDAVVLVGGQGSSSPIVVSSSSNTVSGVIPGVDLNLVGVSNETVSVSTSRDVDGIVADISKFVTDYNAVMDRIDEVTSFDQDTKERGPLLGDSTVSLVEDRLARTMVRRFTTGPSDLQTLNSVGISFGDGARLSFDEEVFREKFTANPEGVRQLFAGGEGSVGEVLNAVLDDLTADSTGVLSRRDQVLGDQVGDLNDRIAFMDDSLAQRRDQLERKFANLESVLAGLQDQQSALSQLAALAPNG